jgi:DNA processing protein
VSPRLLTDAQRRDWLRLIQSENVGPSTFRALINRYGGAGEALAALPELSRKGGLARPLRIYGATEAEADIARAGKIGARFVAAGETGYPPLLRQIDGAPPLLCMMGDFGLADREAVAIVGARNASAIGRKFARQLSAEIAEAGYLIVSGLARGIDTAAHEAALGRGTAAVLAGGIDYIYPPENEALHHEIARRGLLITEMVPGTVPRAEHFPRRNRLISGMCRATIVVEAAMRSGSLITARLAAEQNREVFAVPGSPLDPRCEGANKLIRDGATLLTKADDVIGVLRGQPMGPVDDVFLEPAGEVEPAAEPDKDERRRIVGLLSPSPVDVDDLIRESGAAPATVIGVLLELELAGKIQRHPGGRVSLA